MSDPEAMHVIVQGDIHSGFTFIGPFGSLGDAAEYGRDNVVSLGIHDWTVAPLKQPAVSTAATQPPTADVQA